MWRFALLAVVILIEHLLMTRIYRRPSSLQRLRSLSRSARTDLAWTLVAMILPFTRKALVFLTLPGVMLAGAWLLRHKAGAWWGLLSPWVPDNYLAWLLASDLGLYVAHRLMHRFDPLWKLHRLHHAAEELNILTGFRISLGEQFFNGLVMFAIVSLLLGIPTPEKALMISLVMGTLDALHHSELPWDFGLLDYLFVSPRFHRMHHSASRSDHDANYSVVFSFWDYLFGSVSPRYRAARKSSDEVELGLKNAPEALNNSWRSLLCGTWLDR